MPALKIECMRTQRILKKELRRTDYCDQKQHRQQKDQKNNDMQGNSIEKKNNCMDISSYKMARFHPRRPRLGYQNETLFRKLICSNCSTKKKKKKTPERPIILKRQSIIRNRITSVVYMVTKMNGLIILEANLAN